MHAYTNATAAGQALIAAQFATMLHVGVVCHLAIPGRHLLGSLVARESGGSSAPIISASPAANIAGLSLVRDVLLGVLFTLWTAWWTSLL